VLENDRVLLVVDDQSDRFKVYLDKISTIGDALQNSRPRKTIFKHDKLGQELLVSFDETRRLLVLCAPQKVVQFLLLSPSSLTVSLIRSPSTSLFLMSSSPPYKAGQALLNSEIGTTTMRPFLTSVL
jgi:hypothetical protein